MTTPAEAVEQLSARLRADLAGVWARIEAEQADLEQRWPGETRPARLRRLAELRETLPALVDQAREAARRGVTAAIQGAYDLGGTSTALALSRAASWTAVDIDAVTRLAADTYADVLTATEHVADTAKDLIRRLAREHVADRLVTGRPVAGAARGLAETLAEHGITAVVYRDGARHGLADYTDMLLRTKTAEAYQVGGLNQCRHLGIGWVEIMDGPRCGWTSHDDTLLAHGRIITVDEAAEYPISHPRCRRTSSPRPDIESAAAAAAGKPLGPPHTAEDIARAAAEQDRRGRGLDGRVTRRADRTLDPGAGAVTSAAQARHAARVARRG